jgi:hypothetical protein
MNKKVKALNEELERFEDSLILDPEEMESFIEGWSGGLHDYSLRNYALARMQHPTASILAGYKTWITKDRAVMKGQKAIKILAPYIRKPKDGVEEETEDDPLILGFRAVNVFDIDQTGKPMTINIPTGLSFRVNDPEPVWYPEFGGEQLINGKGRINFKEIQAKSPIRIYTYTGTGWENGHYDGKEIGIRGSRKEESKCVTSFHELAHHYLEHHDSKLIHEVREVEADATAYLVSKYFGFENEKARLYIMGYGGDKEFLKGRGKRVLGAANQIIKLLEEEDT